MTGMTDSQLLTLQDQVSQARETWREAFERGTDVEEANAYRELRRRETELREAMLLRRRSA